MRLDSSKYCPLDPHTPGETSCGRGRITVCQLCEPSTSKITSSYDQSYAEQLRKKTFSSEENEEFCSPQAAVEVFDGPATILLQYTSFQSEGVASFNESTCTLCGYEIKDQFLYKVLGDVYHESCLRCAACQQSLVASASCFVREGIIYCRDDHALLFGRRCGRCLGTLRAADLVFRCAHNTFHTHCFTCFYCHKPFAKGDEYLMFEGEIVCSQDYHQLILQNHSHLHVVPPLGYEFDQCDSSRKTPKRPRTILNAQQRRQFKAAFEKSAKPCRKIREQLAKETGLSVRVVQVWFQNQRAKMKKIQRKEDNKRQTTSEESAEKNTEDQKSSDEEVDSEDEEKPVLTDLANPIEKLYHMQNTYFQYS